MALKGAMRTSTATGRKFASTKRQLEVRAALASMAARLATTSTSRAVISHRCSGLGDAGDICGVSAPRSAMAIDEEGKKRKVAVRDADVLLGLNDGGLIVRNMAEQAGQSGRVHRGMVWLLRGT